jgi:hypothetical protein
MIAKILAKVMAHVGPVKELTRYAFTPFPKTAKPRKATTQYETAITPYASDAPLYMFVFAGSRSVA